MHYTSPLRLYKYISKRASGMITGCSSLFVVG